MSPLLQVQFNLSSLRWPDLCVLLSSGRSCAGRESSGLCSSQISSSWSFLVLIKSTHRHSPKYTSASAVNQGHLYPYLVPLRNSQSWWKSCYCLAWSSHLTSPWAQSAAWKTSLWLSSHWGWGCRPCCAEDFPLGAGAVASAGVSLCRRGSGCDIPPWSLHSTEKPLGFRMARAMLHKGFGAKNTQSLGNTLYGFCSSAGQVLGFYLEVTAALGWRKLGWRGSNAETRFSVHTSCPAFSWPSCFLRNWPFSGIEGV